MLRGFFIFTNIVEKKSKNKYICSLCIFYYIFVQNLFILHIDDKKITKLFVVIHDSEVISISKTVQEMLRDFKTIYPKFKDRNIISEHFKSNKFYYIQNPITGKRYIIQKIVNSNK